MDYPISLPFNPKPATIIHLDLNSCFATIEQQANPLLRGKPVAVAAYTHPGGCIIAPSVEAKRLGIKVGMRVKDGQLIYPKLTILPPDPWKYRFIHLQMKKLLLRYTDRLVPKSIDEFVLDLEGYPAFKKGMFVVAREIKEQIKKEIGDWLTVSVGIAPNRFLAKTASALHKPDGLDEINRNNFRQVFSRLRLTDLCGIKNQNAVRLNNLGIFTVLDFYNADLIRLKTAFASVLGYYWHLRLHGWEIDDVQFGRRSYGNSYALPAHLSDFEKAPLILQKLVNKTGMRLRKAGYQTRGVHLGILFRGGGFWHHGSTLPKPVFDSRDIYRHVYRIYRHCPYRLPVSQLAVSCYNLEKYSSLQLSLTENLPKKESLVKAVDAVNEKWGQFVITPARMLGTSEIMPDRVAFGSARQLEEFTLGS